MATLAENVVARNDRAYQRSKWRETMSYPNYFPPDRGYHVIGWFKEGRYYAVPERDAIDAFLTICAKGLTRYDVGVAAWALMSSHPHLFVFDLDPTKPSRVWEFKRYVHGVFAQWLNWKWLTTGKVLDPNVLPQQIAILDLAEEENQIAYIENNLIAAGIVDFTGILDGAVSKRDYLLEPLKIERPDNWFQARTWPAVATIQLDAPPMARAEGFTRATWWRHTHLWSYVAQMQACEERLRSGKGLRRIEDVLAETPHKPRKKKVSHRRILSASTDKEKRVRFRQERGGFRRNYRRCCERLADGEANVTFPWGTCRLVGAYGLRMRTRAG